MRWLVLTTLVLAACVEQDPCYGKRDLFVSPDGLRLTAEEHDVGWARDDCFTCHQAATLHEANCSSVVVDVDAISYDPDDPSTCADCHGDNGVAGQADTGG